MALAAKRSLQKGRTSMSPSSPRPLFLMILLVALASLASALPGHAAASPAATGTPSLATPTACDAGLALFAEIPQTSTPALSEALASDGGLAPFAAKPFHGYCRCSCSFIKNCNTSADCGGGACLGGITCC